MNMTTTAAFAVNDYSYTQSHAVGESIALLAGRGHRVFELMVYPGHLWPDDLDAGARAELRRRLEGEGLRVTTLNMPNVDVNVAAASPGMRRYSLDLLADTVRLAGDLGAEAVIVGPGKPNPLFPMPAADMMAHFYTALDTLGPVARDAGVALWVENMPFAFLPLASQVMEALAGYGDEGVGVVYDVANAVFAGEDPAAGLQTVRSRLRLVHLSDTPREVYRHDPVGRGVVNFAALPPALEAVGYREPAVLELITGDPDHDIPDSVQRLVDLGWPVKS